MGLLVTFLFRNMKGLRVLVLLAMIITVLQVSCDIFAAFPLKFIPSKVQNPGNDPECLVPFLGPIESWFDIPQIDPSLQRDPRFAASPVPPAVQCPVNLNDPQGRIVVVRRSTLGVIVFSILMLLIFGLLSALLAFVDLYMAAYIGQQLTARLRNQLLTTCNASRWTGMASSRKATWSSALPATSPTSRNWSPMAWSICWPVC